MKGIIVIDILECCDKCPAFERKTYSCGGTWNDILSDFEEYEEERSPDCPIRPLPQKKIIDGTIMPTEMVWWNGGYNTCIDEILGGETE